MADLASVITAAANTGASLRTGRLIGIGDNSLTVDIGGGQAVAMPYVDGYQPILGDRVQILQQGMVCLAFGATGGMPDDNMVANPSFELDAAGATPPSGWAIYFDPAGTVDSHAKTMTATGWGAKDGVRWLQVDHGVTAGYSGVYVTSTGIPVQAGQKWSASAYAISGTPAGIAEPTLQIRLAFTAAPTGTYPGSVTSEVPLQIINGPTGPQWIPLREVTGYGVTVPAGANGMMVVLLTQLFGGSVYWDKIVARRLS